jgi:hypothetical protein
LRLLEEGRKDEYTLLIGLHETFEDMGCFDKEGKPIPEHMPHTVYRDQEGALIASDIQNDFFKKYKIRHLTTLGHAPVAERTIRTIKAIYEDMKLHKDAPQLQGNDWKAILKMAVEACNHHAHRATGMTPKEAVKPSNTPQVKQSLEHHRVSTRHYPSLNVGDEVRLYKKKDALDKESASMV